MKEIKLNDNVVKVIQVNKDKKVVTVVSEDTIAQSRNYLNKLINRMRIAEGKETDENYVEEKVITQSHPIHNDEFDPYIGVALALAYNLFGSKTQFRKYVKEEILKEPKEENKKLPSFKELDEKYTLEQLRDIAKANNLKGYTKLKKADLIKEVYQLL